MKFVFPRSTPILLLFGLFVAAAVFSYSVKADSTITIPVPEKAALDRKVTLSLKIPPNTEPMTKTEDKLKISSTRSLIVWDSNPSPKLEKNDEFFTVLETFRKKGWIRGIGFNLQARMKPMDKYLAVALLENVIDQVILFARSSDMTRRIRKCNLATTDIEDLRRMIQRFGPELNLYGRNVKLLDKDLLMLQERFKTSRAGILKVIKVEGIEDGGTIIHLSVD